MMENPANMEQINLAIQRDENQNANANYSLCNIYTWKPIWSWLLPEDKCSLRLASCSFRNMVDEHLGVEIILDNKSFKSNGKLPTLPPASHLTVQDLVVSMQMCEIISHPNLVESILMDGAISAASLSELLTLCPMLAKITVSPGFMTETISLMDGQPPIELPHLKELLFPNDFKKTRYKQNINWKNIENFMVCFRMPMLEKLIIRLFFKCQTDFINSLEIIEKFLKIHSGTLKHLELILRKGSACSHPHGEIEEASPREFPIEISDFGDIKDMNNPQLRNFIAHCDNPSHELLDEIMQSQTLLEIMEYEKAWATWSFYTPIIQNNQDTLKIVKIRYAAPIIDLSAFEKCNNLQQLKLGTEHPMWKSVVNLINFKKLPTSLINLHIEKYTVNSDDLACIKRLKNLNSVELEFLSDPECENTGITVEVVKNIFSLPRLSVIYLEEFENDHTSLTSIDRDIRQLNMIEGDYIIQRIGCLRYGVVVAPKETLDKWYSRLKKYNGHHRIILS